MTPSVATVLPATGSAVPPATRSAVPPATRPAARSVIPPAVLRALLAGTAAWIALAAAPARAQDASGVTDIPTASDSAIVDASTRVVGGARTSIEDWPSVVALLHPGELGVPFNRQFCGGTVIASRWVLTAAHCMYDLFGAPIAADELSVLDGQTNLREPSNGREIAVARVVRHPGYVDDASGRTRDDIALLELAADTSAPPSELFAGDPERYPGTLAAVVGWGATEYVTVGSPPFPDRLRRAVVPLVPVATCNAPESYAGDVVEGQFCAGFPEGGVDTCIGDSGGPLYVQVDGRVQQAGVTSFGRGCALPDYYGIYTSTASYLDWIGSYVRLPIEPVPPAEPVASVPAPVVTAPRSPAGGGQTGGATGGATGDGGPASGGGGSGGGGGGTSGAGLLALLAALGLRRRRALPLSPAAARS